MRIVLREHADCCILPFNVLGWDSVGVGLSCVSLEDVLISEVFLSSRFSCWPVFWVLPEFIPCQQRRWLRREVPQTKAWRIDESPVYSRSLSYSSTLDRPIVLMLYSASTSRYPKCQLPKRGSPPNLGNRQWVQPPKFESAFEAIRWLDDKPSALQSSFRLQTYM